LVPFHALCMVPFATLAWYRLQRYAWYRFSAIGIYLIAMAHGVEKVFWYNLRSREDDPNYSEDCFGLTHQDLTAKPSLKAYRTLTALCPEGSTRPTLRISRGVWHSHWITPTGRSVHALWSPLGKQEIKVRVTSSTRFFSHLGDRLQPQNGNLPIHEGVIFVDGEIEVPCCP